MPNFPLSEQCRSLIRNFAQQQAHRAVDVSSLDFPLTVQQIQLGASGLNDHQLTLLNTLKGQGVALPEFRSFKVGFIREHFEGLRQGCVISLELSKNIFLKHGTGWSTPKSYTNKSSDAYIPAVLENITSEERAKLVKWLNALTRQRRINEAFQNALNTVLDDREVKSAAHLRACWPTLTTVLNNVTPKAIYRSDVEAIKMWRERFRNPPLRGLGGYEPPPEFKRKWIDSGLLRAADSQLVAGQILPETNVKEIAAKAGKIAAEITDWERLATDVRFPL